MENARVPKNKSALMTITPKTCALTSRRAPSFEFEESCDSSSPVKACNGGSIHTLEQTSVNMLAVKSVRSLWRTNVYSASPYIAPYSPSKRAQKIKDNRAFYSDNNWDLQRLYIEAGCMDQISFVERRNRFSPFCQTCVMFDGIILLAC